MVFLGTVEKPIQYLSLSVREHRKTSGVAITPHPLNRPSPNERETSRIPSTRPSLKEIVTRILSYYMVSLPSSQTQSAYGSMSCQNKYC